MVPSESWYYIDAEGHEQGRHGVVSFVSELIARVGQVLSLRQACSRGNAKRSCRLIYVSDVLFLDSINQLNPLMRSMTGQSPTKTSCNSVDSSLMADVSGRLLQGLALASVALEGHRG